MELSMTSLGLQEVQGNTEYLNLLRIALSTKKNQAVVFNITTMISRMPIQLGLPHLCMIDQLVAQSYSFRKLI
jgi:hypothetical protein